MLTEETLAEGAVIRRIGVIGNPRSHAYSTAASDVEEQDWLAAEPDTQEALIEALTLFAQGGVDLLVVNGGDGTLRDVLTALPFCYGDRPPELALFASGNTNLAAWALGSAGTGIEALPALQAAALAGTLRRRSCPVLDVAWNGEPDRRPVRGLFMGAAAFTEGKRIADAEIHRRGVHKRRAVGLALVLALLRSLVGRGSLRRGTSMAIGMDTMPPLVGARFVFLATTLDRLTLGLWPFWNAGPGAISWLDIDSPPSLLLAAFVATLLRRPQAWMQARGYRSGAASRIRLPLLGPFVLDGEVFDPGSGGVTLSAPGRITIVRP